MRDERPLFLPDAGKDGMYVFYGGSRRFSSGTAWTSADAHLSLPGEAIVSPVGDANGDGTLDLLVGASFPSLDGSSPTFWLPGSQQRLSGSLELASIATELHGAVPQFSDPTRSAGDLDGDGRADVLLGDGNNQLYLFYGAPGLFEAGVDSSQADASFVPDPSAGLWLIPAGDRDGDGDAELVDQVSVPGGSVGFETDVVLLSGERERLSGTVALPVAAVLGEDAAPRFPPNGGRVLTTVIPAGDLDADGADDLFSISEHYSAASDGMTYVVEDAQLHIHYGTPALAEPAAGPR